MKINKKIPSSPVFTHEGAKADKTDSYRALRRSVLTTLLWEDNCYENGISITNRITDLVTKVNPEKVSKLAIEARGKFKLRHVPLLLARELARNANSRHVVANTLAEVIQRPDELSEFLSIYWAQGKCPIASQVKKGLALAFTKFDEYSLSKYNKDNAIKLRDVLFLSHAKPINKEQENLWKKLINNELKTPDTWEVELSANKGENKTQSWERLLKQDKLGGLALLKNLRNFKENNVDEKLIINALENMKVERILPFRFIAAARFYPSLEPQLEEAMYKCVENQDKLSGKTAILIDVSGSMDRPISAKSDLRRIDAACGLAILARELCKNVSTFTFSREFIEIPNRRGFALRDAIVNSQAHRDTFMGQAISDLNKNNDYDRLIVFSDEQTAQEVPNPKCKNAYMVNVANNQYGVSYKGNWNHIDGFSEAIFDFITESESSPE